MNGENEDGSRGLQAYLQANLSAHFATPTEPGQEVSPAESFAQAVEAGWQMSTLGLMKRGKLPDLTVPENSNRLYRIASQATTLAGDLPAMMAGSFVGGLAGAGEGAVEGAAIGSVEPGAGTVAGAAAGATVRGVMGAGFGSFAAPAALRRLLMDSYAKGGVKDFGEFWDRGSAILYDGIKEGAVGALSAGAGLGGKALGGAGVGAVSELSTMLMLGNAVEGRFRLPTADEFTDAALLMGASHAAGAAVGKLRDIYAARGEHPIDVARAAVENPALRADIVSQEQQVPESVAGPLPEPVEAAPIQEDATNIVSIADVLNPEEQPPPQPAAHVVPGYVPVYTQPAPSAESLAALKDTPGYAVRNIPRDLAPLDALYFDRLRQGKELIRKPYGNEVAFDPRTDVVVNSKTGDVEISPTGAPDANAERGGRTILHTPDDAWVDQATGDTVIPARRDSPRMVMQDRLEAISERSAPLEDQHAKAMAAAEKKRKAAEEGAAKLNARSRPATEKMQDTQAKREAAAAKAEKLVKKLQKELSALQQERAKVLGKDAKAEAAPEDLKTMSDEQLRERIQKAEDAGQVTARLEARRELLDRQDAARKTAEEAARPDEARVTRQEQPERPEPPPTATPAPPISEDQRLQDRDTILSRVSIDEPTKQEDFLTTREKLYTKTIDKNEPAYVLDKMLQGKKVSRAESRLLATKMIASSGNSADMALHHGVPNFGRTGVAAEPFDAIVRGVGKPELRELVADLTAREAVKRSQLVERAREKLGEAPMQRGDRFQLFDDKGAKSGEGKVIDPDFPNGTVKVRVERDGKMIDLALAKEEVRRNLIARIDGREVRNAATGVDLEAARRLVEANGERFAPVRERLMKWWHAILDYGVDAQYLDAARVATWKESGEHTPLHRVIEEENWGSPLARAEGSEREIINPLESFIKDAWYVMRKADENAAKLEVAKLIDAHPDTADGLIRKFRPEPTYGRISEADFSRISGGRSVDINPNDVFVLTQGDYALKPNQMVGRDVEGPFIIEGPRELIDVYKGMGRQETSAIMKLLTAPAKLERAGIVNSLSFLVRHAIRNPIMGKLFSENNTSFMDIFRALGSYAKRGADFQEAMSAGALTSSVVKSFNDRGVLQAELAKLAPETGMFNAAWNVARNALEVLHVAATASDNAIRLAEYQNAIKSGKGRLQAAYEARNLIPDSQRVGAQMRGLNALIPFLHMHLQGLDKIGQMMAKEGKLAVAMRLAPLMYASAALWWASKDDSRMQDIPHEQRDLFWIIPTSKWESVDPNDGAAMTNAFARPEDQRRVSADGQSVEVNNGAIFRIPKPFEAGIVIGSGTERILEAFAKDNPDAWDGFGKSVIGGVLPNYIPAFAKPVVEQFANKSTFTGSPLISGPAERELPQYRYGDYTSELAKALGKMIAPVPGIGQSNLASPTIIENYVQSWGGYIGSYALELADAGLRKAGVLPDPVRPADTLADVPFVRAFVIRNPGANTQNLRDFYDAYEHHQEIVNSIRARAAEGDAVELDRLRLVEARDAAAGSLDGVAKSLSTMSHLARMIYKMPDMSAREKRQQIDGLYYGMNESAKMGLATMRELAKELEASNR